MNKLTFAHIRELDDSRYHPSDYLPKNWTGTALDFLMIASCPAEDRLWVVCQGRWIDDKTLRLWAVWCARQALALDPDPRDISVCDIAEKFAYGKSGEAELLAVREEASSPLALAVGWTNANDSAWDTAWIAAWDTAWAAGRDASLSAASPITSEAGDAVRTAARDAAWAAQINHLIEMLESAQ